MALTKATRVGLSMARVGETPLDHVYVDPRDHGAIPLTVDPNFDSTEAFQRAHDFAKQHGIGVVRFDGRYKIAKALHTFECPRDDGTVAPQWVGVNGDTNLAPEPLHTMPVCIKWDADIYLEGASIETSFLEGDWDIDTSPIDLNQKIGILITAGSKYTGTRRYRFKDFTMTRYMIARVGEGTMERSYEQLRIQRSGISGLFQGYERRQEGLMQYNECYSGDVFGGWWTQRNATTSSVALLPPYPATDVWSLGWTDFMRTDALVFEGRSRAWSDRHEAMDAFFDTYFFKDANSKKHSEGGRLSNNTDPNNNAIMPTFYGIVGRARTIHSRYGRGIASTDIGALKVLGSHRTPLWYDQGVRLYGCSVGSAYLERVGVVDNRNQSLADGNLFGKAVKDPYRAAGYGVGYAASNIAPMGDCVVSSGVQLAPLHNANSVIGQGQITINKLTGETTEAMSNIFLDMTTFNRKTGTFKRYYRATEQYFFSAAPLRFNSESEEDFTYRAGSFTPTLSSGGVAHTIATAIGKWKRVGRMVFFSIAFFQDTKTTFNAGDVVVGGLPFSGIEAGGQGFDVVRFNNLKADITLSVRNSGTTLLFTKDSVGTRLSGAECNETGINNTSVELSGWMMLAT